MRYGVPGGDRTHDLQLRRLLLYPTELRAHKNEYLDDCLDQNLSHKEQRLQSMITLEPFNTGRSTRIRTLDPLVPNQVRYQTAPHSDNQYSNPSGSQI